MSKKGMEEITIYRFQLETISEALRITNNQYDLRKGETCLARQMRQAEQYSNNALNGDFKKRVNYITGKNE